MKPFVPPYPLLKQIQRILFVRLMSVRAGSPEFDALLKMIMFQSRLMCDHYHKTRQDVFDYHKQIVHEHIDSLD